MEFYQTENSYEYQLQNKDIELCGKYFDVVPDGNLYTLDDYPIFAIRMKPIGISHIMDMYKKKYGFETKVLTYKINSDQYTLYSSDTSQLYNTQKQYILEYFDFSKCKNNELKSIIIVVVNKDDRMIHAIPFIYGIIDNRRKLIFLDAFFSPDLYSGCIIGADFFYRNYNGDIDCYCHGDNVQADHHSCGIIACDFIKNCLKHRYKLAKKIMKNVSARTEVENFNTKTVSIINIFDLPHELKKFSQISQKQTSQSATKDDKIQTEVQRQWFFNHTHVLKYRRDPEPYDPNASAFPLTSGKQKSINTALLEKGHQYAGIIIRDLKQKTEYNYKYWLSLIREQKDRPNIFRRLLKITKKILAKNSNK